MQSYQVKPIGTINTNERGTFIELEPEYLPGLQALDGFSHLTVIWWFSDFDDEQMRKTLEIPKPYKQAPAVMGVFATRSPIRPNPIALSVAQVIHLDSEKSIIRIAYIDANDGTPVLDIKPYTPSLDRVETPTVPEWCSHWPKSTEESGRFNWASEFNF